MQNPCEDTKTQYVCVCVWGGVLQAQLTGENVSHRVEKTTAFLRCCSVCACVCVKLVR